MWLPFEIVHNTDGVDGLTVVGSVPNVCLLNVGSHCVGLESQNAERGGGGGLVKDRGGEGSC